LDITEADLVGRDAFAGFDLAQTADLTALVWLFPMEDDTWFVLPRCWCPKENARIRERRDRVPYISWGQEGALTLTDGSRLDNARVIKQLVADCSKWNMVAMGYDPWNFEAMRQQLIIDHGLDERKMFEVRQGPPTLSAPMKYIGGLIDDGKIIHNGHPVLSWCVANVVARMDANENIAPDKKHSTERIDIFAALCNAMALALTQRPLGPSVYETRGIVTL